MSGAFPDAWLLLKEFVWRRHHDDDYYRNLGTRMREHKARGGGPLEFTKVFADPKHGMKRYEERFHPDQKVPKEVKGFSPLEVATFMFNDVLQNHPELREALKQKTASPDARLEENEPAAKLHEVFSTIRPKVDTYGNLITDFSPVFVHDPEDGKFGIKTFAVGRGGSAANRQNINVIPETSPFPAFNRNQ